MPPLLLRLVAFHNLTFWFETFCELLHGCLQASRERLEQLGNGEVVATICHYGDRLSLNQSTGEITVRQQVATRFDETFTKPDGGWKWTHSQKVDAGGNLASDCAVPAP